ncbi:MAG: hypothetical protein QNJ13_06030 [Paracoccaceae bacterium]|nr:hypothetical protein [Paracoccaceae bacterium]
MSQEEENATDFAKLSLDELLKQIFSETNEATEAQKRGYARVYEQAYIELTETMTGEKPESGPPPEEEFKETARKFIADNRDYLYQRICVELDYCNWKDKTDNWSLLIRGILIIVSILAEFGTLGLATGTWFILSGLLNELCNCDNKESESTPA